MKDETLHFQSHEALDAWLKNLPEYEEWGVGKAKSSNDLWAELEAGETQLTLDGRRRVRVVTGLIHPSPQDPRVLLELSQELADGRKRTRKRPMAEKIQSDENPLTSLYRGLREELRLEADCVDLLRNDPIFIVEERTSNSYPGLTSIYDLYQYEIVCRGLPEKDFTVTEPCGNRSATWGWRELPASL